MVECLEDLLVCVVKIDTDLDVDLIDVSEVGFWDVSDVNVKDDVDLVLVDISGVCCGLVVCSEDLSMVEVIVGPVVGPMVMFKQFTSKLLLTPVMSTWQLYPGLCTPLLCTIRHPGSKKLWIVGMFLSP